MKKCPACELNYIQNDEEMCTVCLQEHEHRNFDGRLERKTFLYMGLHSGQQIEFLYNPKVKATIATDRTVTFEGKEWTMQALMDHLSDRYHLNLTNGSGFEMFRYDDQDKNLYLRWERYYREKNPSGN